MLAVLHHDVGLVTPGAVAAKGTSILDGRLLFMTHTSVSLVLSFGTALLPLNQVRATEADALSQVDEVVKSVRGVSGHSVKTPLDTRLITREALRDMLVTDAEERAREPDWPATKEALIIMGSWPDGYDGPNPFVDVTVLNSAGIYSQRRRALFVVYDPLRPLAQGPIRLGVTSRELQDELTLAHEIVHALQHMHYPHLFNLDNPTWRHQDDAAFALRAAIEGEAVIVSLQSRLGYRGTLLSPDEFQERVLRQARSPGFDPLERVPLLVRERQVYPYAYGYRLSWREGRKLLKSPPVSSEQVLHRKRRRERFLAIDLSRYGEQLSQRGCELVYENTMGELSLSLLLRSYQALIDAEAWEGWDGDRYVTAKCDGRREFAWLTSWDSADDAVEFERAYRKIAPWHGARAGLGHEPVTQRHDKQVWILSSGFANEKSSIESAARTQRLRTRAELAEFLKK